MRTVGVRELRQNLSRILHEVSEGSQEVGITSHGKEIARLVPPRKRKTPEEMAELWSRIDRIAAEVGRHAGGGMSAVDAVTEERA